MISIMTGNNSIFKVEFEYMCDQETKIVGNVYLIDDSGDFKHVVTKLAPTKRREYKKSSMTLKSGIVGLRTRAHIRLWTDGMMPIRIRNVIIKEIFVGEDIERLVYYDVNNKSTRIGIIHYSNVHHAKILSKQTGWSLIDYNVNTMSGYNIIIYLAPFHDYNLDKLELLKKSRPDIRIILWWVGSDVMNLINKSAHDVGLVKRITSKHLCVSNELKIELKSVGIEADVVTLIPNTEGYKPCPLPKRYTVACYIPTSRKEFYGLYHLIDIMKMTPEIDYIVYGNREHFDLPPNGKSLGWVENTHDVLRNCSCLLRITNHDGYPQSIIEAILTGRYVITNHDYPEVCYIKNDKEIAKKIMEKPKLDSSSISAYSRIFNTGAIRERLSDIMYGVGQVQIYIPHEYGENNGVATHIETVKRYSKHNWNTANNIKIVNTHGEGLRVSNLPKINVYTAHSYYTEEDYGATVKANEHVIRNAEKADRIIAVSNYVRDFLVSKHIDEKKITVIHNPVDVVEIDNIEGRMGGLPKNFSLFLSGKKVKRPDLFVELAKRYPKDNFVVIGDIPEDLPNVTKFSKMDRSDVLSIMKQCIIYLGLSKRESCPYALLEAMAMGKRCIVSNFAGQKEVVTDYVDGYLFKPDDIESLCKAYNKAWTLDIGENARDTIDIGKKARETIEKRFDARVQVPKIDSVYLQPKVSIMTFVYCTKDNGRLEQLKECIKSVRSQNFPSYEHIIVDDGSTIPLQDEIIKMSDSHLKYYWKEHTGITDRNKALESFNLCLKSAKGKYMMFLASDDLQYRDSIVTLSGHLDKNPSIIGVVGNFVQETHTYTKPKSITKIIKDTEPIKDRLLKENCVNGCAIMFLSSILNCIDLPPNKAGFCGDYDLWLRISEVGDIVRIPNIVVKYRRFKNATSIETSKDINYRNECIKYVIDSAKKRRGIK